MEVGRANICSLIFTRLQTADKRAAGQPTTITETLFTPERVRAMVATISNHEEQMQYTAYRQLEEWLVRQQVQASTYRHLLIVCLEDIRNVAAQIVWAETAEEEIIAAMGQEAKEVLDNNIFLHKLDAARFTFDDSYIDFSYDIRDNISFLLKAITQYNTLVSLIAKEIDLPELVEACSVSIKNATSDIESVNAVIGAAHDVINSRYSADDNGIGAIKHSAFADQLRPLDVKISRVPAAHRKAAQELLTDLSIFKLPSGGLKLEKAIDGKFSL